MKRALSMLGVLLLAIGAAAAQTYPSRPITMVVPFGAGGPTDALARIVAQRMSATLGQQIVIENVTGASGTIGVGRVARAAPDGYTIVLGNWPSYVVNSAIFKTPFDYLQRLRADRAASGQSLHHRGQERAAAHADRADRLAEGQSRQGVGRHRRRRLRPACQRRLFPEGDRHALPLRALSGRLVRRDARPRRRTHRLQLRSGDHALPYMRQGQVRAYAITDSKRLASAPDIPTVDEAGAPGVYVIAWFGLWMPKGTPTEAIAKLNAAAMEALADPVVKERLTDLGQDIPPAETQTAEALAALLKAEMDKWWPIIREAGHQGRAIAPWIWSSAMRGCSTGRTSRATSASRMGASWRSSARSPPMRRPMMRAAASPVRA